MRKAKQYLIRNPVIRIAAGFLNITLGHKYEATTVDKKELWLLYRGLHWFTVDQAPVDDTSRTHWVNIGYLLASSFVEIKTWLVVSSKKVIVIMSLMTLILGNFGIEVPRPIQRRGVYSWKRHIWATAAS